MAARDTLVECLLLIGSAVCSALFVLRAFAEAGKGGLGAARAPFSLDEVLEAAGNSALDGTGRLIAAAHVESADPVAPDRVHVTCNSPVRLILAFVTAYDFAKHLKQLRCRIPFQAIWESWAKDPAPFKINPHYLIPAPHT